MRTLNLPKTRSSHNLRQLPPLSPSSLGSWPLVLPPSLPTLKFHLQVFPTSLQAAGQGLGSTLSTSNVRAWQVPLGLQVDAPEGRTKWRTGLDCRGTCYEPWARLSPKARVVTTPLVNKPVSRAQPSAPAVTSQPLPACQTSSTGHRSQPVTTSPSSITRTSADPGHLLPLLTPLPSPSTFTPVTSLLEPKSTAEISQTCAWDRKQGQCSRGLQLGPPIPTHNRFASLSPAFPPPPP